MKPKNQTERPRHATEKLANQYRPIGPAAIAAALLYVQKKSGPTLPHQSRAA